MRQPTASAIVASVHAGPSARPSATSEPGGPVAQTLKLANDFGEHFAFRITQLDNILLQNGPTSVVEIILAL